MSKMLAAGSLRNVCPGCRARVSTLSVRRISSHTTFVSPSVASRRGNQILPLSATTTATRAQTLRTFHTSPRSLHDPVGSKQAPPDPASSSGQPATQGDSVVSDIETVVHEARQRFRDTLPKDYLSKEEYELYVRLYGHPLRTTTPEDVGMPFLGVDDTPSSSARKNPGDPVLLREIEGGEFEEITYVRETVTSENDATQSAATDEDTTQTNPPQPNEDSLSDAQVEYISAIARNQREYDALIQLRKDFEAANLEALRDAEERGQESFSGKVRAEVRESNTGTPEAAVRDEIEQERTFGKRVQSAAAEQFFDRLDLDEVEGHEDDRATTSRTHPYTVEGRFSTNPRTLFLPQTTFSDPIDQLLERTSIKHIREAAESSLGGPGLPHSPVTPASKRNVPQQGLGLRASQHKMTQIEADAFIAAVLPGAYAAAMSTLVEVRKRLGTDWLRSLLKRGAGPGQGPRVLDFGGGGAGLAAWQDVVQAEWDAMRDGGDKQANKGAAPPGKKTVVIGSESLRHRVSRFLHDTTFLPRLPDYLHSSETADQHLDAPQTPQPRKVYDVIVASYVLLPVKEDHRRKAVLNQLWSLLSPNGGVLVVIEKAHPRGFEAVADVRDKLLREYLVTPDKSATTGRTAHEAKEKEENMDPAFTRVKEPGMIVAPCTNHRACPMYKTPGKSEGRKDICSFQQRFVRPRFLQQVLEAKHRNHDDVEFSYVAIRRGVEAPADMLVGTEATERAFAGYGGEGEVEAEDADGEAVRPPHMLSLPRQVLPPLKRKGHVQLEVCTPSGKIERWTVPKSRGRLAYHDARKAAWGDLWALGAKTRVERGLRLGRPTVEDDGGVRARQAREAREAKGGKKKSKKVNIDYDETGIKAVRGVDVTPDRRTKGGRKARQTSLMEDLMAEEENR
ncbi:hypothetical protein SODALDRAFT_329725 [Sodiomyces alkalinus F11]|uniref:Rsm22-domain-containing protein n=1 Tax=Sodiomyces alkalinus (strain CBS 110278 / VKM F-3762 / F11) TaxID=1314773 RepID=A0A3N2PIV0_SODAK|nr:hypothetical protein SODALDRAFT_329725 [Sodiomyces alkalinus F11]ROT34471.1 hypothetical protein SODALDRAFT_329725 [Sodiomyces alkalinus F11]